MEIIGNRRKIFFSSSAHDLISAFALNLCLWSLIYSKIKYISHLIKFSTQFTINMIRFFCLLHAIQGIPTKSTALFYHSMAIFAPPIEQKICGLELRYLRKKGKVRAGLSPWANFTNRIRRTEQNWSQVRANKAVLAAAHGTVYWLLNCSLHFFPKNWRQIRNSHELLELICR